MAKIAEFVKKPIVWIISLITAVIGGVLALVFFKRK